MPKKPAKHWPVPFGSKMRIDNVMGPNRHAKVSGLMLTAQPRNRVFLHYTGLKDDALVHAYEMPADRNILLKFAKRLTQIANDKRYVLQPEED